MNSVFDCKLKKTLPCLRNGHPRLNLSYRHYLKTKNVGFRKETSFHEAILQVRCCSDPGAIFLAVWKEGSCLQSIHPVMWWRAHFRCLPPKNATIYLAIHIWSLLIVYRKTNSIPCWDSVFDTWLISSCWCLYLARVRFANILGLWVEAECNWPVFPKLWQKKSIIEIFSVFCGSCMWTWTNYWQDAAGCQLYVRACNCLKCIQKPNNCNRWIDALHGIDFARSCNSWDRIENMLGSLSYGKCLRGRGRWC